MSDGYIKIDTKIDETGIDKGIGSVDKKLKGSTKNLGGFTSGLAKASIAGAGVAIALKKAADTIADLTAAYKKQEKAETQLESAAKNNPYLTDASVVALKNYASELQGLSTTGDEELLPFMASLAAAGRTQDEIMQIMSASLDMAASGAFSLDSAVRNLNKAYGGLSGELGESIPEIKALTSEQLKNGAATKLMAERYKGIAAETAKATGTQEQLNNAIGDLKEEFGAGFEKGIAPIHRFFTELISGWASVKKTRREYEEDVEKATQGIENERGASALASEKLLEYLALREQYEDGLAYNSEEVNKKLKEQLDLTKQQYDQLRANEIAAREGGRAQAAEAKAAENNKKENKELAQYLADATASRDKAIEAIRLKAEAEGVEADEMAILDANMAAYVSLITDSNGLVTQSSRIAKDWLKTVQDQAEALQTRNDAIELANALESNLKELMGQILPDEGPQSDKMKAQLSQLDEAYKNVMDNETLQADQKVALWMEYADKRELLEKQITDVEKAEEAERKAASIQSIQDKLTIVQEFATQYESLMNNIAELAYQMIEDEATIKTDALDKQYEQGEISLEEYEAEKEKIEKDAAKKRYKMAMWEWTAQIASAIANTALGVTKALEMGLPGIIIGSLIGAAGAVQLATIIGNKPIPPSFATGGIVGGTSYTGDRVPALLNSREMILNPGQQRNLFDSINRGTIGGGNVQVYNYAANDVHARAQVTEDGIKIVINKTVAKSMSDGRYNDSYRTMQNGLNGIRLTT